ncbi:hypothetical protein [Metabacillus sediminilitoris]|nr:hypothetical protein [Metabacillus sediminilitoris]QGQ44373.1 hypothetical protein GMB29_03135 [Metabacillus sediminilitoris]
MISVEKSKESIESSVENETNRPAVEEQFSIISELHLFASSLTNVAVKLQDEVEEFKIYFGHP